MHKLFLILRARKGSFFTKVLLIVEVCEILALVFKLLHLCVCFEGVCPRIASVLRAALEANLYLAQLRSRGLWQRLCPLRLIHSGERSGLY